MVIGDQPATDVWDFENEWSEGLCGCCTNRGQCVCAFFCFPCFVCRIFERSGESCCTPLWVPASVITLRSKIRTGFRINGSICEDCIASAVCPLCVALQISNELQYQGL